MHEILRQYIAEKERIEKEKLDIEKKEFLISEGLYEKIYSENIYYSNEYPHYEFDSKTGTEKYYRMVPIEITDSEYEELLKFHKPQKNSNAISTALIVIAWIIFIFGFIAGIIFGVAGADAYSSFAITIALIYWVTSFISGVFILGFSEIIKLLNDIKNK